MLGPMIIASKSGRDAELQACPNAMATIRGASPEPGTKNAHEHKSVSGEPSADGPVSRALGQGSNFMHTRQEGSVTGPGDRTKFDVLDVWIFVLPLREEQQHNLRLKLLGPDFGCLGVRKFLPVIGSAGKRLFGLDIHDFWS